MKVFAHVYCPCIHESAEGVVSLHFTKEGAEKAMEKYKKELREVWEDNNEWCKINLPECVSEYKEPTYTYHAVKEMEIVE